MQNYTKEVLSFYDDENYETVIKKKNMYQSSISPSSKSERFSADFTSATGTEGTLISELCILLFSSVVGSASIGANSILRSETASIAAVSSGSIGSIPASAALLEASKIQITEIYENRKQLEMPSCINNKTYAYSYQIQYTNL